MPVEIRVGDCREVLRTLPTASVHSVVTSPPYFGLRDYGTGTWSGGDPACAHIASDASNRRVAFLANSAKATRGGAKKHSAKIQGAPPVPSLRRDAGRSANRS